MLMQNSGNASLDAVAKQGSVASRQSPVACRLCNSQSIAAFELEVLGKYQVQYFACQVCDSIQTEQPYWLAEAYGDDVHPEDTGYLTRNLTVHWNVQHLLNGLRLPWDTVILDYGGGLGIVPRLLRESGRNAFNHDTYTKSPFGDIEWDQRSPDFIVAAELFEHLPEPAADIADIFKSAPDHVYVRTWRYFGQGKTWDYIGASHGEHVFFYTDKAMQFIAKKYGYHLTLSSDVDALFSKEPLTKMQSRLVIPGLYSRRVRAVAKLAKLMHLH